MSTDVAIIDDRDSSVTYTGDWIQAGASLEFDSTTTVSNAQGVTASVTFVGTSITVFGTVGNHHPANASMSFVIDNSDATTGTYVPPTTMTSDIHHTALYTSPTLSDGQHTLVITQTQAQIIGVVFLDYFMYNTTSTSVGKYFIDDRDARITYTPEWTFFQSDSDFMHTSQGSPGQGASFELNFTGKAVQFYGGITDMSMVAKMSIDGGPSSSFTPSSTPASTTNNLIYSSGDLKDGNHSLVVTAGTNATVWVDYFLVVPGASSGSSSGVSSSSWSSSSATNGSGSLPTSSGSENVKTRKPVGAIVGGVVGGALVLVCLLAAFLCLRARSKRTRFHRGNGLERPQYSTDGSALRPPPFTNFPSSEVESTLLRHAPSWSASASASASALALQPYQNAYHASSEEGQATVPFVSVSSLAQTAVGAGTAGYFVDSGSSASSSRSGSGPGSGARQGVGAEARRSRKLEEEARRRGAVRRSDGFGRGEEREDAPPVYEE